MSWLFFFKLCSMRHPDRFQFTINKFFAVNSDLMAILGLCQKNQYDMAKYRLSVLNKKIDGKRKADFYGDEYLEIIFLMKCFLKRVQISTCTGKFCIEQDIQQTEDKYPYSNDVTSEDEFTNGIKCWLFNSWTASCRRSIHDTVSDSNAYSEHIHWDYDNDL